MPFVIQEPDAASLADAIDAAAAGALAGGGIFAFASRQGVERFFSIKAVETLLKTSVPLQVIVGTDAITNADALLCLEEHMEKYDSLDVLAFVHDLPSTFHPKFCWFRFDREVKLVVGSGNLTSRGIGIVSGPPKKLGNWEALLTQNFVDGAADSVIQSINDWIHTNTESENLLPIGHEDVRLRAIANSRIKYVKPQRTPRPRRQQEPQQEETPAPIAQERNAVLLREIPNNRSGQADITKAGLEFFGYAGKPKKVLIQHVTLDNELGEVVERLLFVNASRNYRIEIREVAELDYTIGRDDGRMILVAVKLDDSAFRYSIVPTTSHHYQTVSHLLGPIHAKGRRLMRTKEIEIRTLKDKWPAAPDHLLPIVTIALEDTD